MSMLMASSIFKTSSQWLPAIDAAEATLPMKIVEEILFAAEAAAAEFEEWGWGHP